MSQLLVRDIDPKKIQSLKNLAASHGRSLQAEIKKILEQVAEQAATDPAVFAAKMRKKLAGRKQTDSVKLLAQDRAR